MIDLSTPNEWQYIDPETGLVFPWYVKSFLDELKTWELEDATVLEIGGGASTLWWNAKAGWVLTLENNLEYIDTIQTLGYRVAKYDKHFLKDQPQIFDIIIIDCEPVHLRDECVLNAINALKADGKLIIDNWEQPSVWVPGEETKKILAPYECKIYKQPNHPDWQTAIFYKP